MHSVNFSYAQTASNEFADIFDGKRVFDNPKSFRDLERLVDYLANDHDIVLDFFAGSGSFAHGVMEHNARNCTHVSCISIQLPEPCKDDSSASKAGYRKISEIARERIRRSADKLRQKIDVEGDFGFKCFSLVPSQFKQWRVDPSELREADLVSQMEAHIGHVHSDADQEGILYELLIKAGFTPTEKIETLDLAGNQVFSIAKGALLICLEDQLTSELIDAVADREPMQFICLDKGFKGNDQLKANAVQTFKSRSQGAEAEMVFKVV